MEAETRPTDNALNAILDLLAKDPSPYVREAVLKRMANTRFKRLPRDFAAVGLALAKKPENLNEDPLGSIRVRCAALEMLGKTDAPEGHQYILDQLGKRDLDINYLGAFAGAAARINTPAALATLKSAMVTHKSRGEAYFRKAAEALGSVEGPEVIAPIRELLTSNASNPELVRLVFERLSKNKTLRENPDFAPLITSLVLSEAFAAEQMRALMVAALDDVKSPIAKDALHEIEAKTKSEQLRRAARKIREANFPPLPQTPKEKPRR
jgi:HEAT repeat protein